MIVSNVLNEEKKQQIIALGKLGWSLRRIERATDVRRETAAAYLKAAGIPLRPPGSWGRRAASKPANGVTTDSGPAKPANEVTADSASTSAGNRTAEPEPQPDQAVSPSACETYRDAIEVGISQGRNAMGIWQDLVDQHGFSAGYQSVKRFIRKLRGARSPEACAVITTAPGEDYGKSRVMVRNCGNLIFCQRIFAALFSFGHIMRVYRASSHLMRREDSRRCGARVAWGPLAMSSALRFISRSA